MPFKFVDAEELYERDPNIKREDIKALEEWNLKQPHLPKLKEIQLILFLQSCYYRSEAAKAAIDNYFTVKTLCPDLLSALDVDLLKKNLSIGFINILPKKTPEGYVVIFMKLLDFKSENFNLVTLIRALNMIFILHLHQRGYENGVVAVFDLKGFTLNHLARMNVIALKKSLYYLQEGVPVRLKTIHFINVVSFIDKLIGLAKPFMKPELYNMLNFHSNGIETLYKHVPKKCLPMEYGGEAPAVNILNETCLRNLLDNYEFFKWHDAQNVDEKKRCGKEKNINTIFGLEGTFKKLDID